MMDMHTTQHSALCQFGPTRRILLGSCELSDAGYVLLEEKNRIFGFKVPAYWSVNLSSCQKRCVVTLNILFLSAIPVCRNIFN